MRKWRVALVWVKKIFLCDYARGLVISDKKRYLEKISTTIDPYCIPFAELSKDVLPPVQCTDIFNYLVLGKSFYTSQRFKAFKSMEAYKYFECGFVNCLGTKNLERTMLQREGNYGLCNYTKVEVLNML